MTLKDKIPFTINSETTMKLSSKVTLFGKLFEMGTLEKTIQCGIPIEISKLVAPRMLGRSQSAQVTFDIVNKCTSHFGPKKSRRGLVKIVMVDEHLHVRNRLVNINRDEPVSPRSPRENFQEKLYLEPNDSQTIGFEMHIYDKASFFEDKFWKIELYVSYEGSTTLHLVHTEILSIQITPHYVSNSETNFDLLFVIHPNMTMAEFLRYQNIFDGLGLDCNYWDITKQNGLSYINGTKQRHEQNWLSHFEGKVIMFPLISKDEDVSKTVERVIQKDIENDFVLLSQSEDDIKPKSLEAQEDPLSKKRTYQKQLCEELFTYLDPHDLIEHVTNNDSGLVIVNGPESSYIIDYLFTQAKPEEIEEDFLQGMSVFTSPSEESFVKKCNEFLIKLREQQPSKLFKLHHAKFQIEKKGLGKSKLGEASYLSLAPLSAIDR